MPKTEIILTHNIVGLGAESDHVKVAAGYARNYLFPQGLAVPLTSANKRRLEVLRQRRAEREAHEFNTMSELSKSLAKLTCIVKVKTGDDGKMFGSVTAGTIADELKHQFEITLDKRKIHLENPIRTVGDYEVELRLHHDVTTALKVHVESTTPLPTPTEAPEAGRGAPRERREGGPPRTFKRGRRPQAEGTIEAKPGAEAKPRAEGAPRAAGRPERAERAERKPRPAKAEPTEKAK
jgi:large subunit ribosomal protein L9